MRKIYIQRERERERERERIQRGTRINIIKRKRGEVHYWRGEMKKLKKKYIQKRKKNEVRKIEGEDRREEQEEDRAQSTLTIGEKK